MTPPRARPRIRRPAGIALLLAALAIALGWAATSDPIGWFDRAAPPPTAGPSATPTRQHAATIPDEPPASSPDAAPERIAAATAAETVDERWLLRGRVLDNEDRGVADARISMWAKLGGDERRRAHLPIGDTVSRADGTFAVPFDALLRFPQLQHRETMLHVVADAEGYWLGSNDTAVEYVADAAASGKPWMMIVRVERGRLLKGRVVTAAGAPVAQANVVCLAPEIEAWASSEIDGSFELELDSVPDDTTTVHLVTADYRYGRARPVPVDVTGTGEVRCPDLVLRPHRQGVRGVVRWPDGRPAARVSVELQFVIDDGDPDIEFVDGLAVPEFHDVLNPESNGAFYLHTDRDGRFALQGLRAGSYHVYVDDREPVVERVVAGQMTDVAYVYGTHDAELPAQLYVDVVDAAGDRLVHADYGCRMWHGEQARVAAAKFAQVGPSLALLATAEHTDFGNHGDWPVLEVAPDTFCIVEASCGNAGPVYAATMIEAGQHRADVRLLLEPRAQTGSLRFEPTTIDGAPVASAWVRFARGLDDAAVPVDVPALRSREFDLGRLRGNWLELPPDGVVQDLPAGDLLAEVLFAPTGKRNHLLSMHPTLLQRVHVPNGTTRTVPARMPVGSPIWLRIEGAAERSYHSHDPKLYLVDEHGHTQRLRAVHPAPGEFGHVPHAVTICTRIGYPPGRYRLSLHAIKYRTDAPRELEFEHDHRLGGGPAVVSVVGNKD